MDREIEDSHQRFLALAAALAHPLQTRILTVMAEPLDGISVREISERTKVPERRVRYHLDRLLRDELVRVARREGRRGTLLCYYRLEQPLLVGLRDHPPLPEEHGRQISIEVLRFVMEEASEAIRAGTFARGPHTEIRIRHKLDERGCEELAAILLRAAEEAQTAMTASARRALEQASPSIDVTAALFCFECPARGAAAPPRP
jgi:DNA-binding transcriptional ArsR family regulator